MGLPVLAPIPLLAAAIDLAMAKKRIDGEAEVLTLPRHNVNGIVEEKRADFAGRFSHENARVRLVSHQDRKCPDVILMGMANKNGIDRSAFDWLPVWERVLAYLFRMHPAIQNQSLAAGFEVVRVRADFGVAGEVDGLHGVEVLSLPLSLILRITQRLRLSGGG